MFRRENTYFFLATAFFAGAFLAGAFLATAFFAGAFLATAFFAGAFFAAFLTGISIHLLFSAWAEIVKIL